MQDSQSQSCGTHYGRRHRKLGKAGDWFFGVRCTACDEPAAYFKDPSGGKKPISFEGPGILRITCPACGHVGEYRTSQVERFEAVRLH